jgi:4-hydroxyphenylpyruvate dioxygenase
MRLWIKLAKVLNTAIISIPSTCLSEDETSGDLDLIVSDMREVADLAAVENISLAYEALAWGTHVDTWEGAWEIVKRVDRPNFGICLDTFNIAARVYADPTAASRRNTNAEGEMKASIERLVHTIDVKKIAYVQVVDAEYLAEPLVEGHRLYNASQRSRMSWSRNCRLFYGEQDRGAYLPVKEILQAIIERLGFNGWISAELFNESLTVSNPEVPEQHAKRAAESWKKIEKDFNTVTGSGNTRSQRRLTNDMSRAQL